MAIPQFVKSTSDFEAYRSKNKYLVVNFTAAWCGPCQTIKPIIDQLYGDVNLRYSKIEMVRVDLDTQQELASQYQVTSIPTFLFMESGNVVKRVTGANVPELIKTLDEASAKATADASAEGRNGNGEAPEVKVQPEVYKEVSGFIPKGYEVLNGSIDFGQFEALNALNLFGEDVKAVFKAESKESGLASDADSQLLVYVPFLNICKVHSVLIKTRKSVANSPLDEDDDVQAPSEIKIWPNAPAILSFDDASNDNKAPHSEKIVENEESAWYEFKVKFVRFQNVQSLNIFLDGEDEDAHTVIEKVLIVGVNGDTKDQGTLARDD